VKTSKAPERAIPDMMHAAGANTSIRRTCKISGNDDDRHKKIRRGRETKRHRLSQHYLTMTPEK
jgi:hypothetical protein